MSETSGAIGVVLAGGRGLRFGSDKPKQFHNLAGRMIAEYAIESLLAHPDIDEVVVVYPSGFESEVGTIQERALSAKPLSFVTGSGSGPGSTRAGLRAIAQRGGHWKVLFHDAVRPFLTAEIIDRCLLALDECEAVDTVVPAIDTIVTLNETSEWLESIPTRARLRRGQTPQGFWLDRITHAYDSLDDDQLSRFTDDCGVMLHSYPDVRIAAVDGHENNIKITSPLDMFLAEQLLFSGFSTGSKTELVRQGHTVAVIFGGTSGLGLASAERMRELGWQVEVASRSTGVDVRDLEGVRAFLDSVQERHGHIDLIANFAGVLHVGRVEEMDLDTIDELLSINVMGSFVVSQVGLGYLAPTQGHLVLTSSSSYYRGRAGSAAYSASKAAVVNLTQALADEWADEGVAVSCLVPRRADTVMRRTAFPDEDPSVNLKPEAVAEAMIELYQKGQSGVIRHVY